MAKCLWVLASDFIQNEAAFTATVRKDYNFQRRNNQYTFRT